MELFNEFTDTIFLKESSSIENQIEDLKIERNRNPYYKEKIDYDIRMLEIGLEGEKEIEYQLKNSNIGMYVLHDVLIEYKDLEAQFDYIIITKGYTYLVECKNLIGNIYVDSNGQFIRKYEYKDKKYTEAIYSPYTQIVRSKEILKKRWTNRNSKLRVALQKKYFDKLWYKPIVVLSNSKSILNIKTAPKEVRENTVRVDNLVNYIKNDLKKYDKLLYSTKKEMEELANSFLEEHSDNFNVIADKYKNRVEDKKLEHELKLFRNDKAKKNNIPAYYIFTNEELNNIIVNKPKKINDLKTILSDIKIKCHGKQIINIINKVENNKNGLD